MMSTSICYYFTTILWTILLVVQLCTLVPISVYYLFPHSRPHPKFTWHQAIGRKLMFILMFYYTRVRLVTPLPLAPGRLGERFVRIPPSGRSGAYKGPLQDSEIQPTTISGTWYPSPLNSRISQEKGHVILHFHGGGYVIGSGQPLDSGYFASKLTRHVASRALFVNYRLSCTPAGRFPAALQDAVSAYLFLLGQDIDSSKIILSGDSAGGHLAISLLKYLVEELPDVPYPARALLWSPWLDLAGGSSASVVINRRNYETDYIPAEFAEWSVASFAPAGCVDLHGPYVTLSGRPFKSNTLLWVHVGAQELLCDEVMDWVTEMRDFGCDVTLRVEDGAPHDIVESGHINGFGTAADEITKAAATWCEAPTSSY